MKEYLVDDPKVREKYPQACYDLVANVSHDGEPGMKMTYVLRFHWPMACQIIRIHLFNNIKLQMILNESSFLCGIE